ncbi:MAG: SIMPL domain-containing protein [Clostridiaceae bacterium]
MDRTISIKGNGKLFIKPDQIEVSLSLESVDENYEKAMLKAEKGTSEILKAITDSGFKKEDVKTTDFSVRVKYESIYVDNIYKEKFVGYQCNQGMLLTFDLDNKKLTSILSKISTLKGKPRIDVRFTVKNKDKYVDQVLISAVEDSRNKAELLAKSAGVTLGNLVSMDYGKDDFDLYSPTVYARENFIADASMKMAGAPEMNPQDISLEENILMVWEIK